MEQENQDPTEPNAGEYIAGANGEESGQSQAGSVKPADSQTAQSDEGVKDTEQSSQAGTSKTETAESGKEGKETRSPKEAENPEEGEESEKREDSAETEGVKDTGKNTGRASVRIRQLVKEKHEFEAKVHELEAKLNEKRASELKEPEIDSYDEPKEYAKAYAKWEQDKSESEGQGTRTEKIVPHEVEAAVSIIGEDLRGNPEYADFEQVVMGGEPFMSDTMIEAAAETDCPGAVAYHLAKNRKAGREIMSLAPTAQVLRIGKLSESLKGNAAKKPQAKTTKAPPPVTAVKGSGGTETNVSDLSAGEYIKAMNRAEGGA